MKLLFILIKYILRVTQPSGDTIFKTTPALGQEEFSLETSINVNQLPQPSAKGLSTTEIVTQQASSIIEPSTTTGVPILDATNCPSWSNTAY